MTVRGFWRLASASVLVFFAGCGGGGSRASVASDGPGAPESIDSGIVDRSDSAAPAPTGMPTSDAGAAPDAPDASRAAPSPSCAGRPAQPQGDTTWTIPTSTGNRSALVHVPPGYDPTRATPLVLNFHGLAGSPSQEEGLTLMDPESDSAGFLLVYPQGTGTLLSWNAGACCGQAAQDDVDDVGFVGTLLDTLEAQLCVDADRVFATGMSNGGFLSHRLGCELSTRIAAIAPVAGVMGIPTCNPTRPVPVMEFHGTEDPLVPYDGDPSIDYPSVADTIAGWVQRDGCQGAATTTYDNGDATCVTYGQCNAGAEVTLCTIAGGGHTWPGGTPFPVLGATSTDISATDAMWTFFQQHAM
jgi:polyhydroxybutyrate depolymerase